MGERGTSPKVEPRATGNNSLGTYSLRIEEGFNQGVFIFSVGEGHGGTFLKNLSCVISELLHVSHYFSFWKGICVAIIILVFYHWLVDVWVSQWRETTLRPDVVKTIPKWLTLILTLFLNFWVFLLWEGNECYFCAVERKRNISIKFETVLNYVLYYYSFVFLWGRVMYPSLLISGLVMWLAWNNKIWA